MALQVIIIFVGKSPFHIVNEGLTLQQWGICIGFSAITFVVSIIVKLIPIHNFIENFLPKADEDNDEDENENRDKDSKKDESKEKEDFKQIGYIEKNEEKKNYIFEEKNNENDEIKNKLKIKINT